MCGTGCGHLPEDEGHHFFFFPRSLGRCFFLPAATELFFPRCVFPTLLFPGGVLLLLLVMLVPTGCTYGKSTNKVVEYLS